ncbi:MAG: DUF3667 domain-containing protein [Acidobacteriota bacterium]
MTGPFCAECGQPRVHRITFKRTFRDGLDHVLSLDSAFLRTLIGLVRRPGRVCREYLEGRRKSYVAPVKYTFFAATIFALIVNFLDVLPTLPSTNDEQTVRLYRATLSALGYLAFLYVLPIATLQAWLFRRPRYGIAECYAALLFFYGQILILGILLAVTGLYATPYGYWIVHVVGLPYLWWLLTDLYDEPLGWILVKVLPLYFLVMLFNIDSDFVVGFLTGIGD